MSKLIQEKNGIFALYKKTIYINETYALNTPLPRNATLIEELE
jgi:hypothetical protein